MWKISSISLSVLLFCINLHVAQKLHQKRIRNVKTRADTDFDMIVLSQEWPGTVCRFYKYAMLPGGHCILPKKKLHWTVHGIWPRTGNEYPEFCDRSWNLNPKAIRSIADRLQAAQTSIYKESSRYLFWGHEWRRHGTCAASLKHFSTPLKYFSKSIELNQKYPVSDMLEAANIYPSDTAYLEPEKIVNAIKAVTKKSPMIGCYVIDKVAYLQEVRICLDKEFNVIDCNRYEVDEYCYSSRGLIYPATE